MTPAPTINHMNVGLKKVEYGRMVGVLSGLFVRCTIQKRKEWSANDSSPYHKPHECGFKKSGVRQNGRGVIRLVCEVYHPKRKGMVGQ